MTTQLQALLQVARQLRWRFVAGMSSSTVADTTSLSEQISRVCENNYFCLLTVLQPDQFHSRDYLHWDEFPRLTLSIFIGSHLKMVLMFPENALALWKQ